MQLPGGASAARSPVYVRIVGLPMATIPASVKAAASLTPMTLKVSSKLNVTVRSPGANKG